MAPAVWWRHSCWPATCHISNNLLRIYLSTICLEPGMVQWISLSVSDDCVIRFFKVCPVSRLKQSRYVSSFIISYHVCINVEIFRYLHLQWWVKNHWHPASLERSPIASWCRRSPSPRIPHVTCFVYGHSFALPKQNAFSTALFRVLH